MPTKKEIIHHFIANIFTILNFEILRQKISIEEKNQLLDLVKMANLAVAHEKILLNQKPKFFKRSILLNDILQVIVAVCQSKIQKMKTKIILTNLDFFVKIDRYYFAEALNQMIDKLLDLTTFIEFNYDSKRNILNILHDGKVIACKKDKSLLDYLSTKDLKNSELGCQLALVILELHGTKVKFSKGKISIPLGEVLKL